MRNEPPISISSPREISTSRPAASAPARAAARPAALFTTSASSAPVTVRSSSRQWSLRLPRVPCRDRARGCCSRRRPPPSRDRRRRQRRAAEIGVQHDASRVEDRTQLGRPGRRAAREHRCPSSRAHRPGASGRRPATRAPHPPRPSAAHADAAPESPARAAAGPPTEARAAVAHLGAVGFGPRRLGRHRWAASAWPRRILASDRSAGGASRPGTSECRAPRARGRRAHRPRRRRHR